MIFLRCKKLCRLTSKILKDLDNFFKILKKVYKFLRTMKKVKYVVKQLKNTLHTS